MLRKLKYLIFLSAVAATSCKKDFLNINTDPNNPTTIKVGNLLSTTQRTLGDALSMDENNGGMSEILEVYMHQMTTREEADKYGIVGTDVNLNTIWSKLYSSTPNPGNTFPIYGVLQNLEDIIKNASAAGNMRYVGIAKVLKAYTFSQLVDVFGDVPFSQANKLKEGIIYPKFDKDAAIYDSVFNILDAGIANLNDAAAANAESPGADDLIYGGSVDKWIKAANTIKFKLLTQVRKVKDVSAQVNALISEGKMISRTSESFLIPYGPNGATDDRNPGFFTYFATQRSNHVSPWFYEILKGYNKNILTGNPDPRIPYYIYNQVTATQPPREGNQTEYRDGPFVSIYFGSVGPDRDRTQQNTISLFGIYPVGGKYDDGSATIADANSGTGAAPYRMITYADRLYLEAELMQTGVIAGDAKAKLEEAIRESFRQIDYVVTQFVKPTQAVPAIYKTTAGSPMETYISKVLAEYDAGSGARKLEVIMTQKWISSLGSAVDQYTDYRRTGYPIIFNPADPTMAPGGKVQPPINGDPVNPGAQKPVPVQLSKSFPLSLPWFQGELETNPNAPAQKTDLSTAKIFWMP
jgi:hypothetical protein